MRTKLDRETEVNAKAQRCQDAARQSRNLNSGIRVGCDGPEGTSDHSPAFQRWVCRPNRTSPEGTAELADPFRPALRDSGTSDAAFPALKRWAILKCPSGTVFVPLRLGAFALSAFRATALVGALLGTIVSASAGTTRYVWQGSPSPAVPYTSWATAARTIQDAVDAAVAGDEIVVTNGTHATGGRAVGTNVLVNRVAVDKPLTVRSVNGPLFTLIQGSKAPGGGNGDGAVRCVYLANGASLFGLTLTNGATRRAGDTDREQKGGGLWCESATAVVSNCVLTGNKAYQGGGGTYQGTLNNCTLSDNSVESGEGGGAYYSSFQTPLGELTLNNCTLSGNSANFGGGARGGTLNNCTLTGNWAYGQGGGALSCVLNNCTLSGNSARDWGGGADGGMLNNCLLTGNSVTGGSSYGGGARASTLNNCTLTGNTAKGNGGGAEGGTLNNCIVYYNTAPGAANYVGGNLNYCCTTPLPGGVGNLDAEPQLASAFRLSAGSPCLGKGNYAAVSGVDIDGEPWANPPAMGCDQYYSGSLTGALTVLSSASNTNVVTSFSVDFQGLISGRVSDSRWEFGDGTVVSNRPYASHAWSAAGDYPVVLRAYNNSNPGGVTATVMVHVATQPVHYVALGNTAPAAPYSSWATAATNIQDAVDAATITGALVLVSNGVYQTGGRAVGTDLLVNRVGVNKPLMVRSVNGPQFTVIQGQQVPFTINGDGAVRCVYLTNGASLAGFTLTNGAARASGAYRQTCGGGLFGESGEAVSNCVIVGNSAYYYGGGAFQAKLSDCTLRNNSTTESASMATGGGGACTCTLNNCTLTGNVAKNIGGGVAYSTLSNCTLTGNSTGRYDGGGAVGSVLINCTLSGNAAGTEQSWSPNGGGASGCTLINCILTGNWAHHNGGGVAGGTLYNCTISGNQCPGRGGGAYWDCTLNNCTVTGNLAGSYAGGAYRSTLNDCTVVGNSAGQYGGGVVGEPPDPGCTGCIDHPCIMNNCIVYSNTAPTGANYYQTNIFNFSCTTPLPASGVGNISAAPLFVDYAGGNLRLQSNSPCVNRGNNASVVSTTDLDGNPRISGGIVDLGAYEYQFLDPFHAWLQQYGLPCDGSADYADADGDGHNNWQEWRCATCPTNAASVLALQTPVVAPPGVLLRWGSDSSHTYHLERAASLGSPAAFSLLQSNIPGVSPMTSWADRTAPRQGRAFYRVRTDSGSVPVLLQLPVFVPAEVTLRWSSVTNRTYTLERSINLAQPQTFSLVQSNILGQAATTSCTDTNALGPGPFFYRVRVED
jgi:parallel beta-helix repeat protein